MEKIINLKLPFTSERAGGMSRLYAQVFAGEPWNEVSRCPECGSFSGSDPLDQIPCQGQGCSGKYSEAAYPFEETKRYIASELSRPQAEGLVVPDTDIPLAFGWGYASDAATFSEAKYSDEEMRKIISDLLILSGVFFYISEVGVAGTQRGKGLGKNITSKLAESGKNKLASVVLRTNENSPMRYIAQGLGMKAILGLQSGLRDAENESRVLFVGGAYGKE